MSFLVVDPRSNVPDFIREECKGCSFETLCQNGLKHPDIVWVNGFGSCSSRRGNVASCSASCVKAIARGIRISRPHHQDHREEKYE